MKKIISLLAALATGFGFASAQSFTVTCDGKPVTNGSTIEIREMVGSSMEADFLITSTSTDNVDFSMKFEDVQPENAIISICGFGGCRMGNSIDNETLEPGKTYGGKDDKIDIAYLLGEDKAQVTMKVTMSDNTAGEDLVFTLVFDPEMGTANENRELAGVNVYPNPADGLFNLNVPARAQVEIFSANGQVVRQMEVGAGQTSLQLNNAGIYFIRVRANGKQAVKRLVVR